MRPPGELGRHRRGRVSASRRRVVASKAAGVALLAAAALFPITTAERISTTGAIPPAETASPATTDPPASGDGGNEQRGDARGPTGPAGGLDFPANQASQRSSVSRHDIAWEFDGDYPVGQYANGDWWVVGPVVLTAITPGSTGGSNGENINPGPGDQGYDSELGSMQRLDFPATVEPGSSVVKGVSRASSDDDGHRGKLQTAAVLTVVAEPPPKNGATAFRPPYFGPEKRQYLTTDLHTDLLPTLDPPGGTDIPPLSRVESSFERLQLDHNPGNETNRWLHPVDNLADYGSDVAVDTNFAALRLMLDDPLEDKAQALVNYVQYGIDLSTMAEHDSYICADTNQSCAGHGQGRTLPLVFAATLLDAPEMKEIISAKADILPENYSVTRTDQAPTPLFGDSVCSVELYDQVRNDGAGPATCRDPHGYIDGGESPGSYLVCCMSQAWKGAVTAMHLLPALAESWPESGELIEFIDRYVTFGLWTRPDPHDRFPSSHGSSADEGHYRVPLADALWDAHNLADRVTIDWPALG